MGKDDRRGQRKSRSAVRKLRCPQLGYYLIVTDTAETEKNYLLGLRDSLPKHVQRNIVIKVVKTDTCNIVETCIEESNRISQYSQPWIVFDRDEVTNFDEIITEASRNKIHVGWSNPCIEIWFYAYFGSMPHIDNSKQCCSMFLKIFKQKTENSYKKSDANIYHILSHYGNEDHACIIASRKRKECRQAGRIKPSDMCPCTTMDTLVKEIVDKQICSGME